MEYTCFQGMALPLHMEERNCPNVSSVDNTSNSASIQLLGTLHAQRQQVAPPDYYNSPQFTFPAVSWSTTDPTLLIEQTEQKQQPAVFFNKVSNSFNALCDTTTTNVDDAGGADASCCGFSSFPSEERNRSSTDPHHVGLNHTTADELNLELPLDTPGISSNFSRSSIDPFSVGGRHGNYVSHSQWMQACSQLSEQYYSCDASMPQLVSDYYLQSHQNSKQPSVFYTSSTSVDCCGVNEADSCGSSDRDRSTISEEINWTNGSNHNSDNSDVVQQQPCKAGSSLPISRGGNLVTGLMSSPITGEFSDEFSSSVATAVDDVEFPNGHAVSTTLDVEQHHWKTTTSASDIKCATPIARGSWMPSNSSVTQAKSPVMTLDPLLLLDSVAGVASSSMQLSSASSSNSGLLLAPSPRETYKRRQQACYTLDTLDSINIPTRLHSTPASRTCGISSRLSSGYPMASQTCNISARLDSGHPVSPSINLDVVDCSTTSSSLYKDFYGFPSRQLISPSTKPVAAAGVQEINVGLGSKRGYCSDQFMLLSPRKPNATSIEPQSVAARHRRKKISQRVSILEKLIPGGNKMDTASMLDEAIQYVKFLQLQVQLLESMGETGETEKASAHGTLMLPEAGEGCSSSATTKKTTNISHSESTFHAHCKVDNTAITNGFQSCTLPLALLQQSKMRPAGASPGSTTNTPLILSEVLQEQLFKQKLCLVSLRQYCPQQQQQQQIRRSC